MKKTNRTMKVLAWVLALIMALTAMLNVAALADDVNVHNETETIKGDVDGQINVRADDNSEASLTVTGTVTNDTTAVIVEADDGGSAEVETGDIVSDSGENQYGQYAVGVQTHDEDSEAEVRVGDITSSDNGLDVSNSGGTIDVTAGDIQAENIGMEVLAVNDSEWSEITEKEFNALDLKEPDSQRDNGSEHSESFDGGDGVWYTRDTHSDDTVTFRKSVPVPSTGTTTVETGSVTVKNTDGNGWVEGVRVVTDSKEQNTTATVNGSVTVESSETVNGLNGTEVYANGGNASLTVNGDVSVKGEGNYSSAVQTNTDSDGGNANLTVNGDINVSIDQGTALEAGARGIGSVNVQAGNITAKGTNVEGVTGISIDSSNDAAKVTVSAGTVSTDGTGIRTNNEGGEITVTTGGIISERQGVSTGVGDHTDYEWMKSEEFAGLNLGKPTNTDVWENPDGTISKWEEFQVSENEFYIHESSGDGDENFRKETHTPSQGKTTLVVNGDVTVTNTDYEWASGIDTNTGNNKVENDHTVSITVNGDISVHSGGYASGARSNAENGTTTVEINGDVNVVGEKYTDGVSVEANNGTATMTVNGDVNAAGHEEGTTGVRTYAREDGAATLTVNGDLTAAAGNESFGNAIDVDARGENAKASANLNGDISVTAHDDTAVTIYAEKHGTATASINGDINADAEKNATAIHATASDGSIVSVKMEGDITATAETENATGISAGAGEDSTIEIDLKGDVTAEGGEWTSGINTVNLGGEITLKVEGDIATNGNGIVLNDVKDMVPDPIDKKDYPAFNRDEFIAEEQGENGAQDLYCHREGDKVIFYYATPEGEVTYAYSGHPEDHAPGTTKVTVDGDVTVKNKGVVIELENDKSTIDLIVDGTITGETSSVVVSTDTVADNMVLTVWEVKPNENGNLVERVVDWTEDSNGEWHEVRENDREIEKKIQYIIRLEQPDIGSIYTSGTKTYEGYEVANEGDTVTLKVNIPAGYRLIDAFNGTDVKVKLLKDANGEYYLVVPRGGAVTLSVTLGKIQDETNIQKQQKQQKQTDTADEEIAAAAEELLTKNDIAENSKVEVMTAANGEKTVVISPETITENETASTVLKATASSDMLADLKDKAVKDIEIVSKTGTANVVLDVEKILNTADTESGARLVVEIEENSAKVEAARQALSAEYDVLEGAVAVNAMIVDENGNIKVLDSADIVIRLNISKVDGMKILFIDEAGNVTDTGAIWVDEVNGVPGHWEVPYLGAGTYVPVTEK